MFKRRTFSLCGDRIQAILGDSPVVRWCQATCRNVTVLARGHAFLGSRLYRDSELSRVLADTWSEQDAAGRLGQVRGMNGSFAVIIVDADRISAIMDAVRSIPVFFAVVGGQLFLADNAESIVKHVRGPEIDRDAGEEFFHTGYVTGPDTLYRDVFQVPAGTVVEWEAANMSRWETRQYFQYRHSYGTAGETEAICELREVVRRCHERLIRVAGRRTLVVPLSGGYDSRLILTALRELGYQNVLTYTYGFEGGWEAKIAQRVAGHLGYPWHFVPYNIQSWREWQASKEWHEYFAFAHNASSLPVVHDWPSVWHLRRKGILPADSIFVPGHTGDVLSGSRTTGVPELYLHQRCPRHAVAAILRFHYRLFDWPGDWKELEERFRSRIHRVLGDLAGFPDATSAFESWEVSERQAKWIVNSVRAYEYWGYGWGLPLWDMEFVDYWRRVPLRERAWQRLYRAHVDRWFRSVAGMTAAEGGFTEQFRTGRIARVWAYTAPVRRALTDCIKRLPFGRTLRDARTRARVRRTYATDHCGMFGILSLEDVLRLDPLPRTAQGLLMRLHYLDDQGRLRDSEA